MRFHVLFRSKYTDGKWIPWSQSYASQEEAEAAIRERETYDKGAERIVCWKSSGGHFYQFQSKSSIGYLVQQKGDA